MLTPCPTTPPSTGIRGGVRVDQKCWPGPLTQMKLRFTALPSSAWPRWGAGVGCRPQEGRDSAENQFKASLICGWWVSPGPGVALSLPRRHSEVTLSSVKKHCVQMEQSMSKGFLLGESREAGGLAPVGELAEGRPLPHWAPRVTAGKMGRRMRVGTRGWGQRRACPHAP